MAQRLAGQTLAGIGDTERAVDKNLQRSLRLQGRRLKAFDLLDRKLAGEHRTLHREQRLQKREPLGRGDCHLSRCVELDIRRDFAGEFGQPKVLDNQRIHPSRRDFAQLLLGRLHFAGENQRIHRDEPFHAVAVQVFHQLVQVRIDEIIRPQARIEPRQTKINGIRPRRHRRTGAVPVPRRSQKFGSHVKVARVHARNESRAAQKGQARFASPWNPPQRTTASGLVAGGCAGNQLDKPAFRDNF